MENHGLTLQIEFMLAIVVPSGHSFDSATERLAICFSASERLGLVKQMNLENDMCVWQIMIYQAWI